MLPANRPLVTRVCDCAAQPLLDERTQQLLKARIIDGQPPDDDD